MACLLLPASSLLAQVSVSVDVGYGNKGYTYQSKGINAFDGSLPRGHNYYFAPRIGFLVSDGLRMGVQIGASYSSYDYVDGFFDSERLVWKHQRRGGFHEKQGLLGQFPVQLGDVCQVIPSDTDDFHGCLLRWLPFCRPSAA